ncbi:MAG: carbon storage regulator [Chloroflexi bacterium]|jgi:carbon storage regulator|nr:MAG: carbon storage regulator [Chloroflexota bacterium]
MLILTRKAEQGIVIHNNIIVRVLSVDGDRVKIGIDAPRSIGVLREELCDAVRDENRAAIQGQAVPSASLAHLQEHLRPAAKTGTDDA